MAYMIRTDSRRPFALAAKRPADERHRQYYGRLPQNSNSAQALATSLSPFIAWRPHSACRWQRPKPNVGRSAAICCRLCAVATRPAVEPAGFHGRHRLAVLLGAATKTQPRTGQQSRMRPDCARCPSSKTHQFTPALWQPQPLSRGLRHNWHLFNRTRKAKEFLGISRMGRGIHQCHGSFGPAGRS